MIAQRTSQVGNTPNIHIGSRQMALRGVILCLALCALSAGIAPASAASPGDTGVSQQASTAAPAALDAQHAAYRTTDRPSGISQVQRSRMASLPDQPLALVVTSRAGASDTVFLGTESQGLYTSGDGGGTWQAAGGRLSPAGAGSLAVSALAVSPGEEQVVYAAVTFSMATPQGLHSRQLVFVSVDDGGRWFEMSPAPRLDQPITQMTPLAGHLLAVVIPSSFGTQLLRLDVGSSFAAGLYDPDPAMRAATARAFGFSNDRSQMPILLMHQRDPDPLAREQVAQAINRLGDAAAVSLFTPILSETDAANRAGADAEAGLRQAENAIPQLSAMLQQDAPRAGRYAAEALASIGTPAAMAALTAPLSDLQMTSARQIAMGVLEQTGQPAVPAVVAALSDSNAVVRANAAEMLGWLSPVADPVQKAAAAAILGRLLTDPAPTVQAQAAWALGEMGTAPAPMAALPVTRAPLAPMPDTFADFWADSWTRVAMAILLVVLLLAIVLIGKGPRPYAIP